MTLIYSVIYWDVNGPQMLIELFYWGKSFKLMKTLRDMDRVLWSFHITDYRKTL